MSNVSLYKETLNSSAFSFPSSPFLNSYEDSFEMMLGAEVYKQHIYISKPCNTSHKIVGVGDNCYV